MTEAPNAQQIENWNNLAGPNWVRLQAMFDAQLETLGEAAIERAAVATGERVLDAGCGCGTTTFELAAPRWAERLRHGAGRL